MENTPKYLRDKGDILKIPNITCKQSLRRKGQRKEYINNIWKKKADNFPDWSNTQIETKKIIKGKQIRSYKQAGRKKKIDQLARIKTIELTADFSIKIMEAEDFTAEFFFKWQKCTNIEIYSQRKCASKI